VFPEDAIIYFVKTDHIWYLDRAAGARMRVRIEVFNMSKTITSNGEVAILYQSGSSPHGLAAKESYQILTLR
jgi:hypothetical protein